jgi:hypothetical protein
MTTAELHDLEVERALLGHILRIGKDALAEALAAGLDTPHLWAEEHRIICRTLLGLASDDVPIDLLSTKKRLQESEQLDKVGVVYLTGLLDGVPIDFDVPYYAGKLVELSSKRKLLSAAANLESAVVSSNGEFSSALEDIRQALEVFESRKNEREQRGLGAKVRDYIDKLEGSFTTTQVYADLGVNDTKGKAAIRQALSRLKGIAIQSYGEKAGLWRVIRGDVSEMDFDGISDETLDDLWLPFDLHNYVEIHPGNVIVIAGDPDAGKTAAVLKTIDRNIEKWECHYFNSEMGPEELKKRLDLFNDFPRKHPHFHAYERSDNFQDVIQPGKHVLNVVDYLEVTDEFYLVAKYLSDIYKNLHGAIAIVAIQKKGQNCDLPLGGQRALEKPRLVISLSAGNKTTPNRATILKCKNRKTQHSMIGKSRTYKLVSGSEFLCDSPEWS